MLDGQEVLLKGESCSTQNNFCYVKIPLNQKRLRFIQDYVCLLDF